MWRKLKKEEEPKLQQGKSLTESENGKMFRSEKFLLLFILYTVTQICYILT